MLSWPVQSIRIAKVAFLNTAHNIFMVSFYHCHSGAPRGHYRRDSFFPAHTTHLMIRHILVQKESSDLPFLSRAHWNINTLSPKKRRLKLYSGLRGCGLYLVYTKRLKGTKLSRISCPWGVSTRTNIMQENLMMQLCSSERCRAFYDQPASLSGFIDFM